MLDWRQIWNRDEQMRMAVVIERWEKYCINVEYWRIIRHCLMDMCWIDPPKFGDKD